MKRLLSVIMLMILISLPLMGCSESSAGAPSDPVVTRSQLDGAIKTVNDAVNRITDRIDKLPGNQAPDLSAYEKKTESASAIVDAITKLKNDTDQTWIKSKIGGGYTNPSSPNNPVPGVGQIAWQNGTYQLFNVSGGQGNSYIFFTGSSATTATSNMWQLIVTNTSAGPLYISPQVLFTTNQSSPKIVWDKTPDGNGIKGIKIAPNGWSSGLGLNISPDSDTATNTLTIMPNTGGTSGGGIFVGSGASQSWYITVAVATTSGNSGPWTINVTPIGWWTQ